MSEKDSKDIKVERNPKINIQQADPSLPPSEPKPAATVLLVRTIEEAVEVFMIQRSIKIGRFSFTAKFVVLKII